MDFQFFVSDSTMSNAWQQDSVESCIHLANSNQNVISLHFQQNEWNQNNSHCQEWGDWSNQDAQYQMENTLYNKSSNYFLPSHSTQDYPYEGFNEALQPPRPHSANSNRSPQPCQVARTSLFRPTKPPGLSHSRHASPTKRPTLSQLRPTRTSISKRDSTLRKIPALNEARPTLREKRPTSRETRPTLSETRPTNGPSCSSSRQMETTVGNTPEVLHEIPCGVHNHCRLFIYVQDFPGIGNWNPIRIASKVPNAHYDRVTEKIHFGNNQYNVMASVLKSLNPSGSLAHPKRHGKAILIPVPAKSLKPLMNAICTPRVLLPRLEKTQVSYTAGLTDSTKPSSSVHDQNVRSFILVPGCPSTSARTTRIDIPPKVPAVIELRNKKDIQQCIIPRSEKVCKISMNIPGYEVIEHLITPYHLRKSSSGSGTCYKKFEICLSRSRSHELYQQKIPQIVLLRLIATKSRTGEITEEKRLLKLHEVEINRKLVRISKSESHRFNIDITRFIIGSPTSVVGISASIDLKYEKFLDILCYISLVRKKDVQELLINLKTKPQIPYDQTQKLIMNSRKDDVENGILIPDSNFPVSLKCPLGKTQITIPCKGMFCDHFSCFDASNFLQTYHNARSWICPICDSCLDYEDLRVDSFFEAILSSINRHPSLNGCQIEIDEHGTFFILPGSNMEQKKIPVVEDLEASDLSPCSNEVMNLNIVAIDAKIATDNVNDNLTISVENVRNTSLEESIGFGSNELAVNSLCSTEEISEPQFYPSLLDHKLRGIIRNRRKLREGQQCSRTPEAGSIPSACKIFMFSR